MKAVQEKQRLAAQREQTNRLVAQAMQEKAELEREGLTLAEAQLQAAQAVRDEIARATAARRAQLQLAQQRQQAAAALANGEESRLAAQQAPVVEVAIAAAVAAPATPVVMDQDAATAYLLAQQLIDRLTRNGGDPAEWRARAAAILAEADTHVALVNRRHATPRRSLGSIVSMVAGVALVAGCSVATAIGWQNGPVTAAAAPSMTASPTGKTKAIGISSAKQETPLPQLLGMAVPGRELAAAATWPTF